MEGLGRLEGSSPGRLRGRGGHSGAVALSGHEDGTDCVAGEPRSQCLTWPRPGVGASRAQTCHLGCQASMEPQHKLFLNRPATPSTRDFVWKWGHFSAFLESGRGAARCSPAWQPAGVAAPVSGSGHGHSSVAQTAIPSLRPHCASCGLCRLGKVRAVAGSAVCTGPCAGNLAGATCGAWGPPVA